MTLRKLLSLAISGSGRSPFTGNRSVVIHPDSLGLPVLDIPLPTAFSEPSQIGIPTRDVTPGKGHGIGERTVGSPRIARKYPSFQRDGSQLVGQILRFSKGVRADWADVRDDTIPNPRICRAEEILIAAPHPDSH